MRCFKFQQTLGVLLIVSMLTLTPAVTVYGQQPVKQDTTQTKADTPSKTNKQVAQRKLDLLAGARPLSEAEMNQIEGGAFVPVALAVAGLGLAAYNTWANRRAHQRLMEACRVTPRRR